MTLDSAVLLIIYYHFCNLKIMKSWPYILSAGPAAHFNDENKRTGGNSKQSKFFSSGKRGLRYITGDKAIYEYKDPRKQFYNIALKIIKL